MSGRYRNYCFTNFGESAAEFTRSLDLISYYIYGVETCPTTGAIHHQGYIELREQLSIAQLKKRLQIHGIHLEQRHGTQLQAINYCKKGIQTHEEWCEFGVDGPNWGIGAEIIEFGKKKVRDSVVISTPLQIRLGLGVPH